MADLGFEIHNRFYPLVRFEDWLMSDFVLARKLTGVSTDELLSNQADSMLLQETLVAIAVAHERKELSMEQVRDYIYGLKPNEVKEIGFEFLVEDDAAVPPAEEGEPLTSDSSESSEQPGEEGQAMIPEATGEPG